MWVTDITGKRGKVGKFGSNWGKWKIQSGKICSCLSCVAAFDVMDR